MTTTEIRLPAPTATARRPLPVTGLAVTSSAAVAALLAAFVLPGLPAGQPGTTMTHYMGLLATSQPWHLILVIPLTRDGLWHGPVDVLAVGFYLIGVVPLFGMAALELGVIGRGLDETGRRKLHVTFVAIFLVVAQSPPSPWGPHRRQQIRPRLHVNLLHLHLLHVHPRHAAAGGHDVGRRGGRGPADQGRVEHAEDHRDGAAVASRLLPRDPGHGRAGGQTSAQAGGGADRAVGRCGRLPDQAVQPRELVARVRVVATGAASW